VAQVAGTEAELLSACWQPDGNAVRYTPEGGRIDVGWHGCATAEVPSRAWPTRARHRREHLPRLTERFYRVDGSRSRETGGTGLGLAIVKHVVQRHGGELDIDSEPGRGSRFTLVLPAPGAPGRVRSRPHGDPHGRSFSAAVAAVDQTSGSLLVGGPAHSRRPACPAHRSGPGCGHRRSRREQPGAAPGRGAASTT
jgi:two-component system phosphate regulon sensor histidine kinase PhoR